MSKQDTKIQEIDSAHVAKLDQEVIEARNKASQAEEEAEANALEAARLHQRAESEAAARVRVEEALAPRRLTKQGKSRMTGRLRLFRWQPVSPWYHTGDFEGGTFAQDIASMLYDANWYVFTPASVINMAGSGKLFTPNTQDLLTGVQVVSTPDEKSRNASAALLKELIDAGFDANEGPEEKKHEGPMIWVNVEVRPLGPQGAAKLRAEKTKNRHP